MTIKPGAFRFNTDSMKLEIFRGSANYSGTASMAGIGTLAAGQWEEIEATSPEVQTGGTRGVIAGGYSPGATDAMNYINISSTGNALDFGDLSSAKFYGAGFSSRTHGFLAGDSPSGMNAIERWVIASTGSSADYSDLSQDRYFNPAGMSNSTRGVIAGGQRSDIEYITMSSTATGVNFGI